MNLKVKIQTSYKGKTYSVGSVIKDCSTKDANQLIKTGFAVKITAPKKSQTKEG